MELEIRHLRVICTVAETGSVSRAAAALRVSQPGLTAQLHRIERMLGCSLFVRHRGGITATPFGEIVLARARAILPTIDELRRAAEPGPNGDGTPHVLRVGSVNAPILAGLVAALRSRYPEAAVTTRGERSSVPLVDLVGSGRMELAVVGEYPGYELVPHADVVYQAVATEPVFVLLSSDHPLAEQPEIALADLAGEPFALPAADDDRTREYYALACLAAGFEIQVAHEMEGTPLFDLVRAGLAISLCQATLRNLPGVAIRALTGTPLWYRHLVVWHRAGPFAAHAADVAGMAAAAYRDAVRRNTTYPAWLARHQPVAAQPGIG
jgi:DNA-binding transcriptional LysR family regulator